MKKGINENKFTVIVFAIFVGLFIIGALLYGMIMPSTGKPVYGNRLDGIEKVALKEDGQKKLVEALEKEDIVDTASVDIKGRIINVIITVKEDTSVKSAQKLADVITKNLTKEQVDYYDLQMFVKNKKEGSEGFPFIGYKGNKSKGFTF